MVSIDKPAQATPDPTKAVHTVASVKDGQPEVIKVPREPGLGPTGARPHGDIIRAGAWYPSLMGKIVEKPARLNAPAGLYLETVEPLHVSGRADNGVEMDLPGRTEVYLQRGMTASLAATDAAELGGRMEILAIPLPPNVPAGKPTYIASLSGITNRMDDEPWFDGGRFINLEGETSNRIGETRGGGLVTAIVCGRQLVVVDTTAGVAFVAAQSDRPDSSFDGFFRRVKVSEPTPADSDNLDAAESVWRQVGKPTTDWMLDSSSSTLYRVLSGGDVGGPKLDKVVRFGSDIPILEATKGLGGRRPTQTGSPDAGNAWLHGKER
jgi:hypothetical protein